MNYKQAWKEAAAASAGLKHLLQKDVRLREEIYPCTAASSLRVVSHCRLHLSRCIPRIELSGALLIWDVRCVDGLPFHSQPL
jgi:hypothetical protein